MQFEPDATAHDDGSRGALGQCGIAREQIVDSQRRRRLIAHAMTTGHEPHGTSNPTATPLTSTCGTIMELDDLERMARFPPVTPPEGLYLSGNSSTK